MHLPSSYFHRFFFFENFTQILFQNFLQRFFLSILPPISPVVTVAELSRVPKILPRKKNNKYYSNYSDDSSKNLVRDIFDVLLETYRTLLGDILILFQIIILTFFSRKPTKTFSGELESFFNNSCKSSSGIYTEVSSDHQFLKNISFTITYKHHWINF